MPVPTKPAALMLPLLTMPPPALALPKTLTVETRMPFCSDVIEPAFVIAPAKMPTLLTKMAWLLAEEMLPVAALTIEPVKVAGPSTPMPVVLAETVPLLVMPPMKVEIPTITVLLPTETWLPTLMPAPFAELTVPAFEIPPVKSVPLNALMPVLLPDTEPVLVTPPVKVST